MAEYETIRVDRSDRVVTITLDRPKALNALNSQHAIFGTDDKNEGMTAFLEKREPRFSGR